MPAMPTALSVAAAMIPATNVPWPSRVDAPVAADEAAAGDDLLRQVGMAEVDARSR